MLVYRQGIYREIPDRKWGIFEEKGYKKVETKEEEKVETKEEGKKPTK